ncbi:hypothetical protein CLF_107787 [Clonorchis sinensis]|uniref:Uncharacterized protein n=1 Tax=Clonorchis sinensis TaxID=79923 RepID=G7YH73_CLOSI|nr:hypothetical protein CLF_107787 [Clonorchis sinensis]
MRYTLKVVQNPSAHICLKDNEIFLTFENQCNLPISMVLLTNVMQKKCFAPTQCKVISSNKVNAQISKARIVPTTLLHMRHQKDTSMSPKGRIHHTTVQATLSYGCETLAHRFGCTDFLEPQVESQRVRSEMIRKLVFGVLQRSIQNCKGQNFSSRTWQLADLNGEHLATPSPGCIANIHPVCVKQCFSGDAKATTWMHRSTILTDDDSMNTADGLVAISFSVPNQAQGWSHGPHPGRQTDTNSRKTSHDIVRIVLTCLISSVSMFAHVRIGQENSTHPGTRGNYADEDSGISVKYRCPDDSNEIQLACAKTSNHHALVIRRFSCRLAYLANDWSEDLSVVGPAVSGNLIDRACGPNNQSVKNSTNTMCSHLWGYQQVGSNMIRNGLLHSVFHRLPRSKVGFLKAMGRERPQACRILYPEATIHLRERTSIRKETIGNTYMIDQQFN